MSVLKVSNLEKSFKRNFFSQPQKVLKNISFEIFSGKMTGFLGINGSGKTTTIKCILELVKKDSGEIVFFESHLLDKKIKEKIAYLPEKPQLYDHLNAVEFLEFSLKMSGMKVRLSSIDEMLEIVELADAKKLLLREYSKGMYQRMGLAQALIRNPEFIILDEPMADLDPYGRGLVKSILKRIKTEKKTTILISSHLLQDIEDLCQDIIIIEKGETKYNGPTLDFINKINPHFIVHFQGSLGLETQSCRSETDLQKTIDHLRSQKKSILKIENHKSLEEAFRNFISKEV